MREIGGAIRGRTEVLRIKKGDQGAVAVIASWEDEPDELARRMAGYVPVPDPDDRLVALDLSGGGPLWASRSPGAPAAWTDSGKWVMNYTEGRDARLLVIDSAAAAFGGNENSRSEVRAFVSALDAWACSARCAVLLISHPSKASEGEAAIYSGSTDWRNSVRALWELRAVPISWNSKRSAIRLRNEKASYGLDGAVLWLWPERLVYLKTAFEALTGTSTNWKSARKLRKTFEALPHTGSRSWTSPSRARKIEKARQNDRAAEEEGSGETQEVRSRGFLAESARGCEGSFEGPRRGRGDDADRFAD